MRGTGGRRQPIASLLDMEHERNWGKKTNPIASLLDMEAGN